MKKTIADKIGKKKLELQYELDPLKRQKLSYEIQILNLRDRIERAKKRIQSQNR